MKVWTIRLIWVVVALAVGAVQENWKIDINYVLDLHVHVPHYEQLTTAERAAALKACHAYMPYDYYFNHTNNEWILARSIAQLKKLKWILTVFFVVVFYFLNTFILRTFDFFRPYRRLLQWGYGLGFILSFAIYLAGQMLGIGTTTYAVSREVVGGLQSLIPSMFLLPIIMFQRKFEMPHHE